MKPEYLPSKLNYNSMCELLDNSKDQWWLPAARYICNKHKISINSVERINEGGNLLLRLNDDHIIKCVPPHWRYQGEAEVEAFRILQGKLSLPIPNVVHWDYLGDWIYVIQEKLAGRSLADVWHELSFKNKEIILKQISELINDLHSIEAPKESVLKVDLKSYYHELLKDCIARHTRKGVPETLVTQIEEFLNSSSNNTEELLDDLAKSENDIFIHMDLHPWNLMVEENQGSYSISGVLDFGDAIIGRSKLLELATPLIFLCQGDHRLCKLLLENYRYLPRMESSKLKQKLMAVSLLRPACDFNFVLSQVPQKNSRENWTQIADELFPI